MQENGYYEIILEVKHYYGNDVSISICKEMIKSADCEEVVRVYIPNAAGRGVGEAKTLENIIFNPEYSKIYKDNVSEILKMIENIKKEYNIQY